MVVRMTRFHKDATRGAELGFASAHAISVTDARLTEQVVTEATPAGAADEDPDVVVARLIEAARTCEGNGTC
ncbi:hypothetical protein AB5I41_24945 [Sphingomonas sp. MMS24-JH45]